MHVKIRWITSNVSPQELPRLQIFSPLIQKINKTHEIGRNRTKGKRILKEMGFKEILVSQNKRDPFDRISSLSSFVAEWNNYITVKGRQIKTLL